MSATASARAATRAARSTRTAALFAQVREATDPDQRKALLDDIVLLNQEVAEAVATRYRGRGVDDDDLRQAALEGLVKAVHKFDSAVRPDLLTYAVPTIRGEVQRWFRDRSWMVRPPRRVQELQWQANRSSERFASARGRPPTDQELSADVGCTVEELHQALRAFGAFRPVSLDRPLGAGNTTTLGDLVVETGDPHQAAEARVDLATLLPRLSHRDRTILQLRYVDELSQAEIGTRMGVTQVQVSRLLDRILRTLRAETPHDTAHHPGRPTGRRPAPRSLGAPAPHRPSEVTNSRRDRA